MSTVFKKAVSASMVRRVQSRSGSKGKDREMLARDVVCRRSIVPCGTGIQLTWIKLK